jgi:hypothetical protein
VQFSKEMSTYYSGKLMNQLIQYIRNSETGKLRFFSKILATFEIQKYLTFNINRYVPILGLFILYQTVIIFKHKFKGLKTQWFKSQFCMNSKIGGLTMIVLL